MSRTIAWAVAAGLAIVLAFALPPAIVRAKQSVRGNGTMAGVALAIGLAFAMLYDPRRTEIIEQVAPREDEDDEARPDANAEA
jgi:hypothetical protein